MEPHQISRDDLEDVMQMGNELERFILEMMEDTEINLAVSALMGATVNTILNQCKTLEDAMFFRHLFVEIFDLGIRNILLRGS